MKKTIVIALALVMTICCNAQSKKELAESVKALTERCANLEAQVANWQSLLMTMQKTQLDQAMEIKALQDSLAAVKKGVKAAAPKVRTIEEILDGYNYTEKEKEVLMVVINFLQANSWEEKYEYVMHEDDVLKDMKETYPKGTGYFTMPKGYAFVGLENATEGKVVEVINKSERKRYYLVKTKEGYKIDYAASFGLDNSDYFYSYRNKGITTPFIVRTSGKIDPLSDDFLRTYKAIKGSNYASFWMNQTLLVSKNDPIYRTLKANEEDYSHRYVFMVAYDPKLDFFVIKKIVKNGTWSCYDKDK